MMHDITQFITPVLMGMLLGVAFFFGLWLTVTKGLHTNNPAVWFVISFILRVSFTVAGFYYLSGGDWKKLLFGIIGFTLVKLGSTRLLPAMDKKNLRIKKDTPHEN